MRKYNTSFNRGVKSVPCWYNPLTGILLRQQPATDKADFLYFPSTSEFNFFKFCNTVFKGKASVLAHPLVQLPGTIKTYTPDLALVTDDKGNFLDKVRTLYRLTPNGSDLLFLEWKGNVKQDRSFHERIKTIMIESDFTDNCVFVGNESYSIVVENLISCKSHAIIVYSKAFFEASVLKSLEW